jgi:mono/diheme cytochrome c family protein
MKTLILAAAFILAVSFAGTAMADGGAVFKSKGCTACHGADGKRTAMAPGLVGSDFIKGDAAAIKATIKDGREGGAKKFANFPLSMPANALSDADLDAVVTYLQGL